MRFQSVKRATISPGTENVTEISPVTENVREISPVTENVTEISPVTENVTEISPVTENVTEISPVTESGGKEDDFVAQPDRHDGVETIVASVFVNSRR